jgi:outer membrane protein
MKKFILILFLFSIFSFKSFADISHFMDMTKVLNISKSGSEAQKKLKERIISNSKKFKKQEEEIRKEESEIISQKKILSADEYKKKVISLRKKVADLQKNKQDSLNSIAKTRVDAKNQLLKKINPIVKKYMEDNKIRLVLEKKAVVLGDTSLEITDQIIEILNKELPSIKLN